MFRFVNCQIPFCPVICFSLPICNSILVQVDIIAINLTELRILEQHHSPQQHLSGVLLDIAAFETVLPIPTTTMLFRFGTEDQGMEDYDEHVHESDVKSLTALTRP